MTHIARYEVKIFFTKDCPATLRAEIEKRARSRFAFRNDQESFEESGYTEFPYYRFEAEFWVSGPSEGNIYVFPDDLSEELRRCISRIEATVDRQWDDVWEHGSWKQWGSDMKG